MHLRDLSIDTNEPCATITAVRFELSAASRRWHSSSSLQGRHLYSVSVAIACATFGFFFLFLSLYLAHMGLVINDSLKLLF
jgi:hypothetical protein